MTKFSTLVLCTALLNGCFLARPTASDYDRTDTQALPVTLDTSLKRAIEPAVRQHPGLSGFRIIPRGEDALLMRLALIGVAERSIDIQYYSMQNDKSGKLLLNNILKAADRGVRVRMLIDDITINKRDKIWSLINTHKNITVRLFNPLATADQGIFGIVTGLFTRLPQFAKRMHNKAFIVDNQLSIVGGRNLGDAYFDNNQEFNFRDIDILAAGPITEKISHSFDRFWNSDESFPIETTQAKPCNDTSADRFAHLKQECGEQAEKEEFPPAPPILKQLTENDPPLIWAKSELLADAPEKVETPREQSQSKPMNKLEELTSKAQHEVIIVSPYFVPGDEGVKWLKAMVDKGIHVRVLTNSLASTDVVAVHTGYKRYRDAVIKAGVELYEMKAIPGKKVRTGRFSSASRASLHTKIYVVDRKDILVGTMNLDPRSVELNTEIALAIYDEGMGERVAGMFNRAILPATSYHVTEPPMGDGMDWETEEKGQVVHYKGEPEAGFWRRVKASLYSMLPFENQL